MSSSLALIPSSGDAQLHRNIQALREMVLNSVASKHSKRNYAKALDEVFTLCANRIGFSRIKWTLVRESPPLSIGSRAERQMAPGKLRREN